MEENVCGPFCLGAQFAGNLRTKARMMFGIEVRTHSFIIISLFGATTKLY